MRTRFVLVARLIGFMSAARTSADDIDFNRDVRPILSDKCSFCHGPDGNTQEADLRLDSRETAERLTFKY